ncbi:hypothetical protein INT45_010601 [Circinella minor]|uniref:Major facilitator superfamily (MFS) profile domain-containing protein n=1 Tax=Circinella minor TaxID=1195481 RepID=A0A8H7VG98_9FUNG|nr:hypothetical protein INT45_010601 [Circinella minor]
MVYIYKCIFFLTGDKVTYRRTPMLFGILALFVTTLLFLFATKYWMLALARILQGISDACVYTLSLTLVSDTFPSEVIGTQLGRVMLFQSIGIAAGTPIGGKKSCRITIIYYYIVAYNTRQREKGS